MKTALIIDDSRLARLTLKRLITTHGIEVHESEGVTEAQQWLENNKLPDIIFLDIMMPIIDGFDGLRLLKANDRTKHVPVIMYSGDISEAARTKAREGGALGYLPKPADSNRVDHLLVALSKREGQATHTNSQGTNQYKLTDIDTRGLSQKEIEQLQHRVDTLEHALEQYSVNAKTKDSHKMESGLAQLAHFKRDVAFLQRQLSVAGKQVKFLYFLTSVSFIISVIALIMVLLSNQ
ncbi:MAG: hypothetical protein CSA10_00185 [Cardiobacteriales bacterium]|nr:MAG: hypothetical protein CSA10_00185 [Cardiobacteriales bacterium]